MIEEKYTGTSPVLTRAHRLIQGRLFSFIDKNIDEDDYTAYVEEPISEDRNDLTPDVIVKSEENEEPVVIIEITTTREFNKQKERAAEYAKQFPACEIFIIDYEREKIGSGSEDLSDRYLEELSLLRKTAEHLIDYDTFLMHGAAIAVEHKAAKKRPKTGTKEKQKGRILLLTFCFPNGSEPTGARTQDPILKRDVLYQLSYIVPKKT